MRRSLLVWALFGHAAISELSQLSGVKRKLDFESAKGCFWREADVDVHMFDLVGSLAIGHLQNGCSDLVHQGC